MTTPDERALEVLRQYHPHTRAFGGYKPVTLGRMIADAIRTAITDEREACAKLAESEVDPEWPGDDLSVQVERIARAIRERNKQ